MNRAVLVFLAALTACGGRDTLLYKGVAVDVPVAVPCSVRALNKPDFALRYARPSDDVAAKVREALRELYQRRAYEAELEAQLQACVFSPEEVARD
ncbi:MAG: hypothetical protein PHS57_06885 [Alphaproteobacteria bacterium]|nr:hypothetical protein [Alphaproteobacteria bacterium]